MSKDGGQGPELSRIVNLIMQNPELIKQIEALAKSDGGEDSGQAQPLPEASAEAAAPVSALPSSGGIERRQRRTQLLSALRPFVSERRGKTLDTLMGALDLFDMIGRG